MKRRSFLKGLLAIPAVAMVPVAVEAIPRPKPKPYNLEPIIMGQYDDIDLQDLMRRMGEQARHTKINITAKVLWQKQNQF